MNPEGLGNSKNRLEDLSNEIELFWSATKAIAATGQRLEEPLKKEISRSRALESQLAEERKRSALNLRNLQSSEEKCRNLEAMLLAQQKKIDELGTRNHHAQTENESLRAQLTEQTRQTENARNEMRTLQERSGQLEQLLQNERTNVRTLTESLNKYQNDWSRIQANDRKMREIIEGLEEKNDRLVELVEKERRSGTGRIQRETAVSNGLRAKLESALTGQTELQKTIQELTLELNRYRQGWGQMMDHDRRLREMIAEQRSRAAKLLEGVQHYRAQAAELETEARALRQQVADAEKTKTTPPPPPPTVKVAVPPPFVPSRADATLNAMWEELVKAENAAEEARRESENLHQILIQNKQSRQEHSEAIEKFAAARSGRMTESANRDQVQSELVELLASQKIDLNKGPDLSADWLPERNLNTIEGVLTTPSN